MHVGLDVIGDRAPYLTENMEVQLQSFEGRPISIEIPQRVTFEVMETEPVMKGQTASGSFKPALLSNGVRTMVPTHIVAGHAHRGADRRRVLCGAGEGVSHGRQMAKAFADDLVRRKRQRSATTKSNGERPRPVAEG